MNGFPLTQLIAFIVGCSVIFLIRKQFPKISSIEIIVILVLYAAMVILFTDPMVKLIKGFVG
jgi:energy-converting hydrogenase Eha subunit C